MHNRPKAKGNCGVGTAYLFSVAQISNLSVSVEIASFRDDFLCKRNRLFVVLSQQLWLRPGRAAPYRRFPIGRTSDSSDAFETSLLRCGPTLNAIRVVSSPP